MFYCQVNSALKCAQEVTKVLEKAAVEAQNAADAAAAVANEAMVLAKQAIEDSAAAVAKATEAADQAKEAAMDVSYELNRGTKFLKLCSDYYFSCRVELSRAEESFPRREALVRASKEEREKLAKAAETAVQSCKGLEKEIKALHQEGRDVRDSIVEAQKAADRAISATNSAADNLSKLQQEVKNAIAQVKKYGCNQKTCESPPPTQTLTLDPHVLEMIFEKISRLDNSLTTTQSTSPGSSSISKKQQLPIELVQVQSQSVPLSKPDAQTMQHNSQHFQIQCLQQQGTPKKQPNTRKLQDNTQHSQPLKTVPQVAQGTMTPLSQGSKRKALLALPQANEGHQSMQQNMEQSQPLEGEPQVIHETTTSVSQGSKRKASLSLPQANVSHQTIKPKQIKQKGDFQAPL